jgi:hypothetical protein
MLWVVGVCHRLKEFGIIRPTADIIRWASIGTVDAIRHLRIGHSGQHFFDFDPVIPAIAKVIEVAKHIFPVLRFDQGLAGFWVHGWDGGHGWPEHCQAAEAGGGLMVAIIQLAIASGQPLVGWSLTQAVIERPSS